MEVGTVTKVVQDFMTVTDGELSLQKGDVVQVLERIDRIWCIGCCAGRCGKVPSNNLMPMETPPVTVDQELFVAIADFPGQEMGDLMFNKGDFILGLRELDSNWWQGQVEDRNGIFPTSYVWKLDTTTLKSAISGPTTMRLFAKVVTAMKAQLEEEMDLIPGETVTILEQIDKDWYRGESGGRRGIFPSSYVNIVQDSTFDSSQTDSHLPSYFDVVSQDSNYNNSWSANICQPQERFSLPSPVASSSSNYDSPTLSQDKDKRCQPSSDLMTFSPEKDKYNSAKPTSHFKELASELDFLNDDYFKQNMPNLFTTNNPCQDKNKTAIQHITQHSAEFDIIPYGITLYPFYAQFDNELSFNEGEIVHLLHHIDNDWIKGEIDGKEGIFPTSYINIVIDCELVTNQERDVNVTQSTFQETPNIEAKSFAKVLFNFDAQMNGDVSVKENEIVFILATENEDWYKVKKQNGIEGLCPKNYLTHFAAIQDVKNSNSAPRLGSSHNLRSHSFSGHHTAFTPPSHYDLKPQSVNTSSTIDSLVLKQVENVAYATPVKRSAFSRVHQLPAISGSVDSEISIESPSHSSVPFSRPMSVQLSRRPSPPSSPPPQPPTEEQEEDPPEISTILNARTIRCAPPIPKKPACLSKKVMTSSSTGTCFQRTGSDRTPHRPAPPVPMPGLVPVRRSTPRPSPARHLSAPAGMVVQEQDEVEDLQPTERVISTSAESATSEEDIRKRNQEQRQNVISELASTEKEYIRDLKITYETFNLYNPQHLEVRGIDPVILFGNILEVIHTAETLLDKILFSMKGKDEEEQVIAPSFLEMADDLQNVYVQYCMNHEDALALLEKYDGDQEIQKIFQKGLETLRYQIACFDMSSILIKPVQRILKYPLILNELFKCTEDTHQDKADLLVAVKTMSEVASYINECKRRKDIVSKYLEDGNATLSTRMSRISLHSVAKMSTRLGAKLSSTLGIGTIIKDPVFEEHERMFRTVEKSMRLFLKNVETFITNLHDVVSTQFQCAEAIADFYQEMKDVDEFRSAQHVLISEVFSSFKLSVDTRVISPITSVLELSEGPSRLVLKRSDKLLDYESCLSKAEKNKDAKTQDELNLSKNTYEALNSQLLEELPKFTTLAGEIYVDCISAFISARKLFSAKVTKEYLGLMELPLMTGCTGDILDIFRVKHNIVCSDIGAFSFSSKYFKQDSTNKRLSRTPTNLNVPTPDHRASSVQSPSQKAFLHSRYPQEKLYIIKESYASTEVLELSVIEGHLVGVIKKQDPMGNSDRWYVDDGEKQGFLPNKCLAPCYVVTPPVSPHLSQDRSPSSVMKMPKQLSPRMSQSPRSISPASSSGDRPPPSYEEVVSNSPQSAASPGGESAIYEEIESPSNQQNLYEEIPELEFYYASYDFTSMGEHMVSLKKGQVVKVLHKQDIQGNAEWWFVEDRSGEQGYVPGNYLIKYE